MTAADLDPDVKRLETERLRRIPNPDPQPIDRMFRELLDLIAAECRRAGMLP